MERSSSTCTATWCEPCGNEGYVGGLVVGETSVDEPCRCDCHRRVDLCGGGELPYTPPTHAWREHRAMVERRTS